MTATVERSDVERFRRLVADRLGLAHDDDKLDFLGEVLRRRMEAAGCDRFATYVERLGADRPAELRAVAEQLTVGESFFFRDPGQIRAFAEVAVPARLRARGDTRRLRILSAGCAGGEEPASLAIVLRESIPELAAWDVEIVAIDVNPAALARAAGGRYSTWALRATSDERRHRYFRGEGKELLLDPAIRAMVTLEERNLVDPAPGFWWPGRFDVVFCRNVLMYFTPEVTRGVVSRLAGALAPDGYLFLGHAETLRGITHDFHLCQSHDTFYYRRRVAGAEAEVVDVIAPVAEASLLLAPVRSTGSWVDVIQRASERIASLAERQSAAADVRDLPAWDRRPVLEAVRRERYADALALLGALPPGAEDDPDALLLRAVLLVTSGDPPEAERVCATLFARDELDAGAHYVMALCREHAGDLAGAVEHDHAAVHLDPGFAMPHLHLGLVARRGGDRAGARRELGQALALLAREDAARVLLFGGGFSRDALSRLCRSELASIAGDG